MTVQFIGDSRINQLWSVVLAFSRLSVPFFGQCFYFSSLVFVSFNLFRTSSCHGNVIFFSTSINSSCPFLVHLKFRSQNHWSESESVSEFVWYLVYNFEIVE